MARPSTWTVRLRTVLVQAMATADWPLSTEELRASVPDWVLAWKGDPRVYHSLRALERAGVCRREDALDTGRPIVDTRYVYWRYIQDETFAAALAALDTEQRTSKPSAFQ